MEHVPDYPVEVLEHVPDYPDEVDVLPVPELHEEEGEVVEHQQAVQVAARILHYRHINQIISLCTESLLCSIREMLATYPFTSFTKEIFQSWAHATNVRQSDSVGALLHCCFTRGQLWIFAFLSLLKNNNNGNNLLRSKQIIVIKI